MRSDHLKHNERVPVMVLGGSANALSIIRSLGRLKIPVFFSGLQGSHAQYSRYCSAAYPYTNPKQAKDTWKALLLAQDSPVPPGSVVFAGEDEAIEFISENFQALCDRYRLAEMEPALLRTFLNKQKTLELAKKIGFPHPGFWNYTLNGKLDLENEQLVFPLIIKPVLSHHFQNAFNGRKYFKAEDQKTLLEILTLLKEKKLPAMITEIIPGPDTQLASYNAYITRNGKPLYEYTKSIIRRYPVNEGLASCHKLEWLPQIAKIGRSFVKLSGATGLINIEFKLDSRDGLYKIIEVNPRFTAHQPLIVRAGLNTAAIVYRHLIGEKLTEMDVPYPPIRLWHPSRDIRAFWQMSRNNSISVKEYLHSLNSTICFPYYEQGDLKPLLFSAAKKIRRKLVKG